MGLTLFLEGYLLHLSLCSDKFSQILLVLKICSLYELNKHFSGDRKMSQGEEK